MIKEKTNYLYKTYPTMLQYIRGNIECSNGWFDIIENLLIELTKLGKQDLYITQLKEKFGTLRVYLSYYVPEAENLVKEAEKASETACEICGKEGKLITSGWYSVRCKEHV